MDADADIISLRSSCHQDVLPCVDDLNNSVQSEIEYTYNLWSGKFLDAHNSAKNVLGKLTDPELKGYRGLWNYLAGSAAWLAGKEVDNKYLNTAREYFRASADASIQIKWLIDIANQSGTPQSPKGKFENTENLAVIERFEHHLLKLGIQRNEKFNSEVAFISENIDKDDSSIFEQAHVRLGNLIGYESGNKESNGSPDPWWMANESFCFIFEDHSNALENSSLHVEKARQVFTHDNWVKANLPVNGTAKIIRVLITPIKKADKDAVPHLTDVWVWPLKDFRKWAKIVLVEISALRKKLTEEGDLSWRSEALEVYKAKGILPTFISKNLVKAADHFNVGEPKSSKK